MTQKVSEKNLLDRLAELPREVRPPSDPWPAVSARIARSGRPERPPGSGRWVPAALAASLAAALAVVLVVGRQDAGGPPPGPSQVGTDPAEARPAGALAPRWMAGERAYLAAFREFVPLGRRDSGLPPAVVDHIEQGWAELRAAEAALQGALRQYPDDRFLNGRMLDLRSRQLDFLQRIAAVERDRRSETT